MKAKKVERWFRGKGKLTPKKLQKLVYYSYVWYLVWENPDADHLENRLFPDKIEAWINGPVIPSIFRDEWRPIPKKKVQEKKYKRSALRVLQKVWKTYGKLNDNQLALLSRRETPWVLAMDGDYVSKFPARQLDDKAIFEYYRRQQKR